MSEQDIKATRVGNETWLVPQGDEALIDAVLTSWLVSSQRDVRLLQTKLTEEFGQNHRAVPAATVTQIERCAFVARRTHAVLFFEQVSLSFIINALRSALSEVSQWQYYSPYGDWRNCPPDVATELTDSGVHVRLV